jgi:hypothetical protein
MKNLLIYAIVLLSICLVTFAGAQSVQTGSTSATGFDQSKNLIQQNYNQLYNALPLDLQARVKSAATTVENVRMMTPSEMNTFLTAERDKSDQYIVSTISQLLVSSEMKSQVENARKDEFDQVNNRMNEFRARRAAHR